MPVRITGFIRPVEKIITPKGEQIFDLGQNIVGWAQIKLRGIKGSRIRLQHAEVLDQASPAAVLLIFWEQGGRALKQVVAESKQGGEIFFAVGPEGGFSVEEVEAAKRRGFVPVTLGKRILRAETASLCFLSILQYEWGDLGSIR